MTTTLFTAAEVSEMVKKEVTAALKLQSEKMPAEVVAATTSAAASSFFSSYAPWIAVYGIVGGAAATYYRSKKPAEGQSRLQCAAKDFSEVFSQRLPLGFGVGTVAALSWPIIGFVAPRIDGSWLKAASQNIANSNWVGLKMATALVTGLTVLPALLAVAKGMQGPSKNAQINQKLVDQDKDLKTLITNWETMQDTTIPSKAEADKNRELAELREQQLKQFSTMPLVDRFARAQRLYRNSLVEKEKENKALHAQLTQPAPKSNSHKPLALPRPVSESESEDEVRPMSAAEIQEFRSKIARLPPDKQEKAFNKAFTNLSDQHKQQIAEALQSKKAEKKNRR